MKYRSQYLTPFFLLCVFPLLHLVSMVGDPPLQPPDNHMTQYSTTMHVNILWTAAINIFPLPSLKVGRHEGTCCSDMLQGQKTCVVHTKATCSRDVWQGHVAGTKSRLHTHENVVGTCPRDMLQRHVPSCELTARMVHSFGNAQQAWRH